MIELKQSDNLIGYSFLDIDDNVFLDKPNDFYSKKTIYLIHYPHGLKVEFSSGVIKSIFDDNYTISHLCETKTGSSGGPLINILNHKVIGLHKGSKKKKDFNLGTLLKIPIQEFKQKYNNFMNSQLNNNFITYFNNLNQNMNSNNNNNSNQKMNLNQNMNFINNIQNIQKMNFNNNNNNQKMNFNYSINITNFINNNQKMNFNNNNNSNQNMQNEKFISNNQNMKFNNNNQNMNVNNNIPFMNFNNNIPFMNFNNNKTNSNNIPFMNFNNNKNMGFNNVNVMDINNSQNMNFNVSPYMNFNNISHLNFNKPNFSFNPNLIFQNMLQMNNLSNMNLPYYNFKDEKLQDKKSNNFNNEKSENLYPYIKGERKEIIFVNSKNKIHIVKIPISLRKDEIYSTAEYYKSSYYYEIKQLIHNNKILENDDSSIDCILNGDSLKIIEFLDCDLSFYDSLLLKHKNSSMINNILFDNKRGIKLLLHFPEDVIEMIKSFLCKFEVPFEHINKFKLFHNGLHLKENEILKNIINSNHITRTFIVVEFSGNRSEFLLDKKGKKIKAHLFFNDTYVYVGTLNQIKELYTELNNYYTCLNRKVIINSGEIEVKENDERTFSEIGIRDSFSINII